jgi:hypothetical protein
MTAEAAGDPVGDEPAHVASLHEAEQGSGTDAQSGSQLFPRQVLVLLLVP